jgi:chorismate dehydratase
MRRLRISAISYLNTAPLIWDFEHGLAGGHFDVSYTVPSQCAAQLSAGTADIGIIPSAAFAAIPGLSVLPGVAIASRQAVRSILLVSKGPIEKIQRVALDTSSLTSVALTKILFEKWWGGSPEFVSQDPDLEKMLLQCDAGLLIGDPALQIDRSRYQTFDLAAEWIKFTGKPFVFAFWAITADAAKQVPASMDLAEIFQRSRDHGLQSESLSRIAAEWSVRLGLTEETIKSYLTENISYRLDRECLEGLDLFYKYGFECKALPVARPLRFFRLGEPVVV